MATPPAGSQPSATAKTRMSTSANQKGGIDMPAKLSRLAAPSSAEPGRCAAAAPSGRAIASASTKLDSINSAVLPSRGISAATAGVA